MTNQTGNRVLTPEFKSDLKDGLLKPLLGRIKSDHTLMLCIRDGFINIYYRGGNIIKLEPKRRPDYQYLATFDKNYAKIDLPSYFSNQRIATKEDVSLLIETIPQKKEIMDIHFSSRAKAEREFQQLVARENSNSKISNDTDYFITDIEVAKGREARYDMLAFKWPSVGSFRRTDKIQLALIEMKYGSKAFSSKRDAPGIYQHFRDMTNFFQSAANTSKLATIAKDQINQLNDLKLFGHTRTINRDFVVDENHFEIIFILANHKPSHNTNLLKELERIQSECRSIQNDKLLLRFFTANSAGYGMYDACMMNIDEYIRLIKQRKG